MALNNRQIRYLRGLTHKLNPIVMVGDKGLSENIFNEIETALDHHELIKVRIRTDRENRREWMAQIAEKSKAEQVHSIGQVVCFYRRNPKKPVIELPA
ncbi:MAG TPA: ribosome assembly RNA-binding protein YhbY [Xanthomonadales bacterium]|nr:ribosome assembly RNA-binding protein YhbY [Xanthomonadales bacterium]